MIMLCATWGVSTQAAESIKVSFDDLPKIVSERNQHVNAARFILKSSEALTGHLARSTLPTLEAHVGAESFRTGPYPATSEPYSGAEIRWNLFRGGRDVLEEQAREAQVLGSQASFERVKLEELSKARRAFWELVYQREVAAFLSEALQQNEANLAAAKKRVNAGLATDTDRIEFEIHQIQLEQDLAKMRLGSENSQRTLSILLGRSEDTTINTEVQIPHHHDDELLNVKFDASAHREVRTTQADSEVAQNQKRQANRWWTPQLDLYASYSLSTLREREYLDQADRVEPVAGVRLSFNLFDGLQARTQGTALGLQAEGLENQAAQTARELAAQFEGARQELALTHDLIHAAEMSVKLVTTYLKRTQSEYARGVKDSPDVFSATQKYIELKRRYSELRRDYQLARSDLLATLGR